MESQQSMHYNLGTHPTKDTIKLMTLLLEKVIAVNDTILSTTRDNSHGVMGTLQRNNNEFSNNDHRSTTRIMSAPNAYSCFHARSIPSISIQAYLTRILKYCPCTNECFLAILVYFDRMAKSNSRTPTMTLRIDSYNIHRLIITGVMIASKLFSDVFFTNARYAKVGGLGVSELNILETEFLALNDYKLFVTIEEFQHYGDQLLLHGKTYHNGTNGLMAHGSEIIENDNLTTTATHPISTTTYTNTDMGTAFGTARIGIPSPERNQEKDYDINTAQATSYSNPVTSMKDLHRKSDEIDQHRLFKRPSFRTFTTLQPEPSNDNVCYSTPSTNQSTLPTPPSASPTSDH
ncbi:cyclin-domain-containing protein [Chlamydoabsidia padenii]|nr:cyclin-domain-containing protein [Chlamydoabsidia padenii]